jgi:hypothetical protein
MFSIVRGIYSSRANSRPFKRCCDFAVRSPHLLRALLLRNRLALTLSAIPLIFPMPAWAFVDPVGIVDGQHTITVNLQGVTVAYPSDSPYYSPPSPDGYAISVVGAVPRTDGVNGYYYSERFAYLCLDASLGQTCGHPGPFTLDFRVPIDGYATADVYLVVDWYDEYIGVLAKQTITLRKRQDSTYTIELSSDDPVLRGLAEVEPGKTTPLLRARVYDQNRALVPDVPIQIKADVVANSGGHQHDDSDRHTNYTGTLSDGTATGTQTIAAVTGQDGFAFSFTAPRVAGDHTLAASCTDRPCKQEGSNIVWVGIKGLTSLQSKPDLYALVGSTTDHPDNHYLTPLARDRLIILAALYRHYYQPVLYLNDASLERGGVLDINSIWAPPHHEHSCGTAVDIRANGAGGALNIGSFNDRMIDNLRALGAVSGTYPKFEVPRDRNSNYRWDLRHFHTHLWSQGERPCE